MAVTTMTPREVRDWRTRLGMTQEELAVALHVDRVQIWRWETGRSEVTPNRLAHLTEYAQRRKVPLWS